MIRGSPVHMQQRFGFPGVIYTVNLRATEVQGLPAYVSLSALLGPPDPAIIAVGAEHAHPALEDCVARGTPACVVFSSGLTELGVEGEGAQLALGGILDDIMEDATIRPAPVDADEALSTLRGLRAFPVLNGARGRPKADLAAVALSRFAVRQGETMTEVDINPLLVLPEGQGAAALDALIIPLEKQP